MSIFSRLEPRNALAPGDGDWICQVRYHIDPADPALLSAHLASAALKHMLVFLYDIR